MAKGLAISSHVVRGAVGLDATVPALQHLGHEVWALPTVLLASRPGLGRLVKHDVPADELSKMLSALEDDGCWPALDAVLAGYFPSPLSVAAAAQAIGRIKAAKPGIAVLVDPVIGDAGRLYVAPATAEAIRDSLLPLATIVTPNLFELGWLSGTTPSHPAEVVQAARHFGPPTVIVTSASETPTIVATLLVGKDKRIERETPKRAGIPNGAGDLFAGLFLGHSLNGRASEAALDASLADLDRVLAASTSRDVLQLAALNMPSADWEGSEAIHYRI
jgi:pyridoxine kinase